MTKLVENARVRHYMSGENYSPYPGMLHSIDKDERINWQDILLKYLWSLEEGDIVSISVEVSKPESVDKDDYWTRLEPHTYGHARDKKV